MNIDPEIIAKLYSDGLITSSDNNKSTLNAIGLNFQVLDDRLVIDPPLALLDKDLLLSTLKGHGISSVDIHPTIDSTNTFLLNRVDQANFHGSICLAEHQSAGRGRRGRHWVSPFGRNIYLSLGWHIDKQVSLSGLSLLVGMVLAGTLRDFGSSSAGLKWPNDILLGKGKLGGILIDIASPNASSNRVVIGIGLNLSMDSLLVKQIDQPFSEVGGLISLSRNDLVEEIVKILSASLKKFCEQGFGPFVDAWDDYDMYRNKKVKILLGDKIVTGIDRGIDAEGRIKLETETGIEMFSAGEVSLRLSEEA